MSTNTAGDWQWSNQARRVSVAPPGFSSGQPEADREYERQVKERAFLAAAPVAAPRRETMPPLLGPASVHETRSRPSTAPPGYPEPTSLTREETAVDSARSLGPQVLQIPRGSAAFAVQDRVRLVGPSGLRRLVDPHRHLRGESGVVAEVLDGRGPGRRYRVSVEDQDVVVPERELRSAPLSGPIGAR